MRAFRVFPKLALTGYEMRRTHSFLRRWPLRSDFALRWRPDEQNLQRSTEPAGSARPDNLPQKKMPYVNEVLGGLSRITFQMGVSTLPHQKMVRSIELPGTRVAPVVRKELTLLSSR